MKHCLDASSNTLNQNQDNIYQVCLAAQELVNNLRACVDIHKQAVDKFPKPIKENMIRERI